MRLPDWTNRLNQYVLSVRDREFGYGAFDCCTFAAGAVEAMTGTDPMPEFRGAYKSRQASAAALKAHGQGTLRKTLGEKLKEVPPAYGQRGDIGYVDGACGVILGRYALFIGQQGWHQIPLSGLKAAFRVD